MIRPMRIAALILAAAVLSGASHEYKPDPDGSYRSRYAVAADSLYRSPVSLALSHDGRTLYVVCENTDDLLRVDTRSRRVTGSVKLGRKPFGIALSPSGDTAYVTNRWDDDISVVDLPKMRVVRRIATGFNPHGIGDDGNYLYVANLSADNISVIDARTGREDRRLFAGREPFGVAVSRDGQSVAVTNQIALRNEFRKTPRTELTLIDGRHRYVVDHRVLSNCVIQQGAAWTPDGKWLLAVTELPHNLVPETQIYQGWMVTYGLIVAEPRPGGTTAVVLLDDVNRYYADPFGIVVSPDGRYVYVSSSGADVVSVIDWRGVERVLRIHNGRIGVPADTLAVYARDLGLSSEYVVARIPVGKNPKGLALSPDGKKLYVAERLSDSVGVIDTRTNERIGGIDLGGPRVVTDLRRGEEVFNYASICFQKQLSCATCHPENNVDGLVYDIAADGGMGLNIVDNRTLRGVAATAPYKWTGINPTLERQEGPRAAQLFFRSNGFVPKDVEAITHYIQSIPLPPNRYLAADGRLTPAQRRGKVIFDRTTTNTGAYIPIANRCVTCHPPPLYTDRKLHNVGLQAYFDTDRLIDTPQLNRIYDTAPYLHDGRAPTLEEIWTRHNPDDLHGQTNDMTKQQLNDLIEYLKTF